MASLFISKTCLRGADFVKGCGDRCRIGRTVEFATEFIELAGEFSAHRGDPCIDHLGTVGERGQFLSEIRAFGFELVDPAGQPIYSINELGKIFCCA